MTVIALKLASFARTKLNLDSDPTVGGLAGIEYYAEAFASEDVRDRHLGSVEGYLEFVPITYAAVVAGGCTVGNIAIGHSLGDPGFLAIADVVMPAVVHDVRIRGVGCIRIARVDYEIRAAQDGAIEVFAIPLYSTSRVSDVGSTVEWISAAVAKLLAQKPR